MPLAPTPIALSCWTGQWGHSFFLASNYLSCYISHQLGGTFGLLISPYWSHCPHRLSWTPADGGSFSIALLWPYATFSASIKSTGVWIKEWDAHYPIFLARLVLLISTESYPSSHLLLAPWADSVPHASYQTVTSVWPHTTNSHYLAICLKIIRISCDWLEVICRQLGVSAKYHHVVSFLHSEICKWKKNAYIPGPKLDGLSPL